MMVFYTYGGKPSVNARIKLSEKPNSIILSASIFRLIYKFLVNNV